MEITCIYPTHIQNENTHVNVYLMLIKIKIKWKEKQPRGILKTFQKQKKNSK